MNKHKKAVLTLHRLNDSHRICDVLSTSVRHDPFVGIVGYRVHVPLTLLLLATLCCHSLFLLVVFINILEELELANGQFCTTYILGLHDFV